MSVQTKTVYERDEKKKAEMEAEEKVSLISSDAQQPTSYESTNVPQALNPEGQMN